MSESLPREDAAHVAKLAKLHFNDQQLNLFTGQLANILDLVETLNEVDTDGVKPTYTVSDNINLLREDVAVKSNQKNELLANAPETQDGQIKVPAIIDEES
ncbi:Asp-tRNA(Asn)/Glu-tRNA(Gln) amidotransferase subunit GatC [Oenococcus oeni]|nr:Asp-tRNA(Asn)/Glu-tRNA(Gln) amidotransferase subunit GatC [Oenococcus oeni]TEU59944.1 Asp-tRNA(Asn)/Glu-tRNA(Gln) amidotransferase subunit GatC [Oenococcus oeni]TEU61740.1 Asp-tRNA(Asn)/Glu-tRNA(Gln) amidotransferase subunit GatC [Oenococcus oeni]